MPTIQAMKTRAVLALAVGTLTLLVTVVSTVHFLQPPPLLPDAQATPLAHYGLEVGVVSDTLISPDDVSFHIVEIQRGASRWLVHIHAHNNADHGTSILDANTDHYFMLGGRGSPGTPYTNSQMFLPLTAPEQAELATHPALPGAIAAKGEGDGWLVADLTHFTLQPYSLMYVYGTVIAPSCTHLADQSTCHPSVGYRTLVWKL